jgi:hypothetical protein
VATPSVTTLRLGTFTKSVLVAVAKQTSLLRDAALDVEEVSVVSSPAQFAALASGELDVVLTGPDNVLAYQFIATNPLATLMDLTIYAAVDRGLGLGLWLAPGVRPEDLSGHAFGVDVATSGFAFVGYALLDRLGCSLEDVDVVALGSTPKRVAALVDGTCGATILNASNELRAFDAGCTNHGVVAAIGPYIGTVLAGRRGVAVEAIRQLRSVLGAASAWVCDEANDEALVAIVASLLGLSPAQSRAHVLVLRDQHQGLVRDQRVDAVSLETLVQLRRQFGGYVIDDDIVNRSLALVDAGFVA